MDNLNIRKARTLVRDFVYSLWKWVPTSYAYYESFFIFSPLYPYYTEKADFAKKTLQSQKRLQRFLNPI